MQDVDLPDDQLTFNSTSDHRGWELRLERPSVERLEYVFELRYSDGRTELARLVWG